MIRRVFLAFGRFVALVLFATVAFLSIPFLLLAVLLMLLLGLATVVGMFWGCLALAVAHDGAQLTTIEGLGSEAELHPLQAAFIERDAFQCGYCTPGQLCSAVGMIAEAEREGATLDAPEIRERMSGNLCRCGAYPNIVAAIADTVA